MKQWKYIYCLIDPTDFSPFYVGQTKDIMSRVSMHCSRGESKNSYEALKKQKIAEINSKGHMPLISVFRSCPPDHASFLEALYYTRLVKQGFTLLQRPLPFEDFDYVDFNHSERCRERIPGYKPNKNRKLYKQSVSTN